MEKREVGSSEVRERLFYSHLSDFYQGIFSHQPTYKKTLILCHLIAIFLSNPRQPRHIPQCHYYIVYTLQDLWKAHGHNPSINKSNISYPKYLKIVWLWSLLFYFGYFHCVVLFINESSPTNVTNLKTEIPWRVLVVYCHVEFLRVV